MATIGNTYPTLLDVAKRTDPNGDVANVVESLTLLNPLLEDMAFVEANMPTSHRVTSRTGLPSVYWRRFNEGIAPSKSQTDQFDESIGMLDGMSKVDVALAKLNGNEAAFRADEDQAFIQSFNKEVNRALFYESVVSNPQRINGLTPRLNATTANPASAQIIKADASASGSDQSSIWLIGWSPKTVFGIYPKGSRAGIQSEDLGKRLTKDWAGTNEFLAWVTYWTWQLGLVVQDSRFLVRICNIDTGTLSADLSTGADLTLALEDALTAMYSLNGVRPVLYMNRKVFGFFNKQLITKKTLDAIQYLQGERFGRWRGIPIRIVDSITNTESVVS